jgi:phosphotransferase system HPr (HPr) family protein
MNAETPRQTVLVTSPQGLHLRPLTAFAQLAQRFESTVTVWKDGRSVDGKSPFEMFSMVSPQGAELIIEANGPDAWKAVETLADFLNKTATEEATDADAAPEAPNQSESSCGSAAPESS